jgi:hypothetical protein
LSALHPGNFFRSRFAGAFAAGEIDEHRFYEPLLSWEVISGSCFASISHHHSSPVWCRTSSVILSFRIPLESQCLFIAQISAISMEACANQRVNCALWKWGLCTNRAELRSSSVRICPKTCPENGRNYYCPAPDRS